MPATSIRFLPLLCLAFGVFFVHHVPAQENNLRKVVLELPPGQNNPRNSEGDFIALKDDRLLFIYSHYFGASGGDNDSAYLASRWSEDGGKTWSKESVTVLEKEGKMNVMSVSLLRLQNGHIALFYIRKNSQEDSVPLMRISTDEAKTWSEPVVCITDKKGYFVLNNDRVIQLKNGRLLMPVALHGLNAAGTNLDFHAHIFSYYSDDNGTTWHCSAEVPNPHRIITQEPGVIELKDGTILKFIRASGGFQQYSYSKDQGETWSPIVASPLASPLSPASIVRIPSTGDLLAVWSNNGSNPNTYGNRTPLAAAISKDEGKTWEHIQNIESDPKGHYCYTAILFTKEKVLLAYCTGPPQYNHLSATHVSMIRQENLYK